MNIPIELQRKTSYVLEMAISVLSVTVDETFTMAISVLSVTVDETFTFNICMILTLVKWTKRANVKAPIESQLATFYVMAIVTFALSIAVCVTIAFNYRKGIDSNL